MALNLAIFSNSGFHSFLFFSQVLVQRCGHQVPVSKDSLPVS